MKEHGSKHPAEVPSRALKSLLKKPGQSRGKTPKNRVVINEKLNEFFAADYIILIKEECCADYEEDCDCCCQEHEMIRLGNCKECRAELNLHFAGGGGGGAGGRYPDAEATCDGMMVAGGPRGQFRCEDPQHDDEEDEEDEEDDDEEDVAEEEPVDEVDSQDTHCTTGSSPPRIQQQQETLSPPEGYKDVCEESEIVAGQTERHLQPPTCSECTGYYHQRTTESEEPTKVNGSVEAAVDSEELAVQHVDEGAGQQTNDQAQQTTPDLHQRYLVETITMTTVTERRIVREISEEETTTRPIVEDSEQLCDRRAIDQQKEEKETASGENSVHQEAEPSQKSSEAEAHAVAEKSVRIVTSQDEGAGDIDRTDSKEHLQEATEMSLTFKLGNVSLVSNSLKPNSAVRQLFPDPRFISPPPAPVGKAIASHEDSLEDGQSEAQKFLITTESLRLFDAVKRSKIAGSRSDSSESESSTIKRTIERNTLRRSLIGKFDTISRKKNLRSKDLSLEERIRQLTCVDQEEENAESSASENTNTLEDSEHSSEFPVRTSPSGEEHPKNERVSQGVSTMTSTTMTTMSTSTALDHSNLTLPLTSVNRQVNVHECQPTYRKITDLFAQKRTVEATNLPDIGLGNGTRTLGKDYSKNPLTKMNSDVRKQFLASLAPLSCVTSNSTDNQEDYYKIASRITSGSNRDSIGYNSDSSYSLEDIEAVLNGEERNYVGPPDVTRGTPTGTGADMPDNTADELLAFVEQDKTRTERIKRRYESDDHRHEDPSVNGDVSGASEDAKNNEDEDDELNDYGFNRRPSVRGIKPQFGTTDEIVQQLRTRSLPPNSFVDVRASFHATWPVYYDKNGEKCEGGKEDENNDGTYAVLGKDDRETNTINRINTMQKQIDDIYQTIAETAVNVQGSIDRGPYLDGTLPRPLVSPMVRIPPADASGLRYQDQKNGQIHYQEQHQTTNARMLRIAGGCDETTSAVYANNLQAKVRRHPAVTIANYHCNVLPATAGGAKCYRTMYFVPYNGTSDPTYQNIQRILPPHSSPNYATHIERYPYPRQGRTDQQQQQQQTRYYPRTLGPGSGMVPPPPNALPPHAAQQTLHLHLHHHQPEEFRVPGLPGVPHGTVHPLQLQQHHHQHHQIAQYHVQSVPPPSYSVITPPPKCATSSTGPPPAGYHLYQVHLGRSAADVQTQTVSSLTSSLPNTCGTLLTTTYNGGALGPASSSSSSSSPALSSPTKLQHPQPPPRANTCMVAERGVPEGAASAPAHDFSQAATNASISTSYVAHSNVAVPPPPPNAQNSVYYAMNV